jgi:hypothetical protein
MALFWYSSAFSQLSQIKLISKSGSLLGLLLDRADGGSTLLRNVRKPLEAVAAVRPSGPIDLPVT